MIITITICFVIHNRQLIALFVRLKPVCLLYWEHESDRNKFEYIKQLYHIYYKATVSRLQRNASNLLLSIVLPIVR